MGAFARLDTMPENLPDTLRNGVRGLDVTFSVAFAPPFGLCLVELSCHLFKGVSFHRLSLRLGLLFGLTGVFALNQQLAGLGQGDE